MYTPYPVMLFARLLYADGQPHQVAFIWTEVQSKSRRQHRKLLFHAIRQGQECTASITLNRQGRHTDYRWMHNEIIAYASTFAEAWAHMPACITHPAHYVDTDAVLVPSLAATTLETLWRALPRATQIAIAPANAPAHWRVA